MAESCLRLWASVTTADVAATDFQIRDDVAISTCVGVAVTAFFADVLATACACADVRAAFDDEASEICVCAVSGCDDATWIESGVWIWSGDDFGDCCVDPCNAKIYT